MPGKTDILRAYLRCMTWKRGRNLCRCKVSYALSLLGIYRMRHRPTFVSIEPADWCMLHCPECPVGIHKTDKEHHLFSIGQLDRFLQENADTLHTIIFYFQGEPLLNKALPEMIHLAKDYGVYTLLSTNGQLLDREMAKELTASGLDRIIVSMDGLTQSSYSAYRAGGNVEKAKAALGYLREEKQAQKARIVIELQCLRLRSNEKEWTALKQQYRQMGADMLTLKTAQFYNYSKGHPLMPTEPRYSRYKQNKTGEYVLRKRMKNRCYRLWSGCVIDAEGNVLPCCFDKEREHAFGNIATEPLQKIWFGDKARQYREQVMHNRREIAICRNCTE